MFAAPCAPGLCSRLSSCVCCTVCSRRADLESSGLFLVFHLTVGMRRSEMDAPASGFLFEFRIQLNIKTLVFLPAECLFDWHLILFKEISTVLLCLFLVFSFVVGF